MKTLRSIRFLVIISGLLFLTFSCRKSKIKNKCCSESHISDKQGSIYMGIPNIFTPNGDGKNDELNAMWGCGISCIKVFKITITETGGMVNSKVFESSDPSFSWDGTFKAKTAKEGKYNIKVEAIHISGDTFSKEGSVWLVRSTSKYCIDQLSNCAFSNQYDSLAFDLTIPSGEALKTCK